VYGALAALNLAQLIKVYAWLRVAVTILTVLAAWKSGKRDQAWCGHFAFLGGAPG